MRAHGMVQDVDLEISEPEYECEHHRLVVCTPHDRQHPRAELLGGEGHSEDAVHAVVKGGQFCLSSNRKGD